MQVGNTVYLSIETNSLEYRDDTLLPAFRMSVYNNVKNEK